MRLGNLERFMGVGAGLILGQSETLSRPAKCLVTFDPNRSYRYGDCRDCTVSRLPLVNISFCAEKIPDQQNRKRKPTDTEPIFCNAAWFWLEILHDTANRMPPWPEPFLLTKRYKLWMLSPEGRCPSSLYGRMPAQD